MIPAILDYIKPVSAVDLVVLLQKDGASYSSDWTTFTASDLPNGTPEYLTQAYNSVSKVLLAFDTDFQVWSTTNGANWTKVNNDLTGGVGGSTSYTGAGSFGGNLYHWVCYSQFLSRFIVALDTGFGYSDDNGVTWVFEEWTTNHSTAFENYWCIASDETNNRILLLGPPDITNQAAYSADGESFTLTGDYYAGKQNWENVRYFPTLAQSYCVGGAGIIESLDGESWDEVIAPDVSRNINAFDYSPTLDIFVFVNGGSQFYYSDDGITTMNGPSSFTGSGGGRTPFCDWSALASRFYTGAGAALYYSTDGTTSPWSLITPPGTGQIVSVIDMN